MQASWYVGFPRNLSDYRAVIYIGDVYRGATYTQLTNYLDAGGKLLFSSNSYGIRAVLNDDLRFMNNYLEATFEGEFPYAASIPITGTNIMAGVNTTTSSDPYPEYFSLNGPHATGIFANPNPGMWTGSRVDNVYRLIYLAWNFEYTGSTAPLDPAKAAIVQRSLNWLLGDVPLLSQNITTGTIGANGGVQPIGVTHMRSLQGSSGAPGGYSLPGVPWTCFFVPETGVAFHGAYWHNNFGAQMSRGCVNMRPVDAKWLFRWSTPVWEVPVIDRFAWDRRGYGTRVRIT